MAKFFVGQRVRIVKIHQPHNSHFFGKEGHVAEVLDSPYGEMYGLDLRPISRSIEDGGVLVTSGFAPEQLVSIDPEGHQPCGESYEQLMDRLRAGVVA